MFIKTAKELNKVYEPLHNYSEELVKKLNELGFSSKKGFYNYHSVLVNGEWFTEYFPIPVVSVKDTCDICIDLEEISFNANFKKEDALKFDFTKLNDYDFEVYGVENYLVDFYNKDMNIEELAGKIAASDEKEIGIAFSVKANAPVTDLVEIIKKLSNLGFHYNC